MNRSLWLLGALVFTAGVAVQVKVRRSAGDGAPARVAPARVEPAGSQLVVALDPSIRPTTRADGVPPIDSTGVREEAPAVLASELLPTQRESARVSGRLEQRLDELLRAERLPTDWESVLDQLARSRSRGAVSRLHELVRRHPDRAVAQQVLRTLERLGGVDSVRAMYAIGTRREDLVSEAAVRLSRVRGRESAPALLEIIADPAAPNELVAAALRSLGHTALRGPVDAIRAIAADGERLVSVRVAAVEALGWIADPAGLAVLIPLLRSPERAIRRQVIRSLGRIRAPLSIAALEEFVETGSNEQERLMAKDALAPLQGKPVLRR